MQHTNSKKAEIIFQTLATVIKEKRMKKEKSIRLLSYEYDIQMSLLSRLENGKNEPKIASLWSVCEALDLNISDLFKEVERRLPDDFSLMDN